MKHLSLLGWLLIIFSFCAALTCADHRDNPAPRFRVKTIASNGRVWTLTYNEAGQLASSKFPNSIDRFNITGVFYVNNRVSNSVFVESSPISWSKDYFYDAQNRLTQEKIYFNGREGGLKVIYDFTYTGNSTTPSSRTTTRYDLPYPNDGPPIVYGSRTETYDFVGGNATSINGNTYIYDTTPNPYKGLFGFSTYESLSPDFGFPGPTTALLNRSFNISERFDDSSVKVFNQNNRTDNATLTYNSNNLVTRIEYTNGVAETFTYETY